MRRMFSQLGDERRHPIECNAANWGHRNMFDIDLNVNLTQSVERSIAALSVQPSQWSHYLSFKERDVAPW